MLANIKDAPKQMQNERVLYFYELLKKRKASLFLKRMFDIVVSFVLMVLFSPFFVVIALFIKFDSKGPVFFRQQRVTTNMKIFKIFKFRSMVQDAEKKGSLVTLRGDSRITRVGGVLRKLRLDEMPQVINVFLGDMSFVGTRPEVMKYVEHYTDEMMATLLLPAGVTSPASIDFKDEEQLLEGAKNPDEIYIKKILPQKMKLNLNYLENFDFFKDVKVMLTTVLAVIK